MSGLTVEKMAEELNAKIDAFKSQVEQTAKESAKASELEAMKEQLKTVVTKEDLNKLSEEFNQLRDKMLGEGGEGMRKSVTEIVDKWLKENLETIKENFKSGKGTVSLEGLEKAVADMTSANITLPVALPAGYVAENMGVPNVALRRPTILDHVNTFSTNQKTLTYVEAIAGEGDFEVVAEGGEKPQLDIDFKERFVQPTKFAGWIKVTDELMEDYPRMRDVITTYLLEKHNLFKEAQVMSYIDNNATAYVTGTNPLSGSVYMPTIMDVVAALQAQILASPNYTDEADFMGDTVVMNRGDYFRLFGAAKDSLGRPLFDRGYDVRTSFTYNGYTFVPSARISAGTIYLYDSTKIDVTNYIPYHVEIGWVNDDFIKNMFVILGESRGHIHIKNHDKRAFVKGTISAIMADIETNTPPSA